MTATPLLPAGGSAREAANKPSKGGPRQRNSSRIMSLFIASTKTSPISPAMFKSRDIASRASTSIAAEESGISVACSLPRCRIIIAKLAKGVARAAGCDTSFCSRTYAMPTEPGVGIVPPLTSAVRRPEPLAEIIRRKLMPNLEQVTWRDPTVTPTRLAISSRLIPTATKPLICSITCGVNLTRLPLAGGLAFVIVMAAPLIACHRYRIEGRGEEYPRVKRALSQPCVVNPTYAICYYAVKQKPWADAGSLNTFGRNEIEVAPISSALLRIACLVILYKTCRVPDQELAADGVSGPGTWTRARLLKQNENRRDGAATEPWSYLVVRSRGSGRARPPRSRRARCAEDAGCRQRRDRFRSCPVSRPRPCHGLSRRRIGPMHEDEPGVLNRRCLHQRT